MPIIINHLPKYIENLLSNLSSNENLFEESITDY